MASKDFLNAAFDSAMRDVNKLLTILPDIPFVDEQAVARSHLHSPKGRRMMLELVKNAVEAGERADEYAKKEEAEQAPEQAPAA